MYGVIAEHGYDGLIIATLMAGLILLVAGYFRAGRLIRLVPEPVINGFTIGIAIVIATSQLKDLLGLGQIDVPAEFFAKLSTLWMARGDFSAPSVIVGIASIVLIVLFRRMAPKWPGLIVAIAVASAAVVLMSLPVETIHSRFGTLPSTLPWPSLPQITFGKVIELLPSSIIIAFLAGVESLLSAMVADRMISGHHRPNAELLAQGAANVGSALFGGMPATGAIARTATNIRAGGKTPVSGLIHAITVLVVMAFASQLVGLMAMPALAGLLILTAWNMSEPHKWRGYFAQSKSDVVLLILTMGLTVLFDLTIAIAVGVALGLAIRLQQGKASDADWSEPDR